MAELKDCIKQIDKLSRALKAADKLDGAGIAEFDALEKALAACKTFDRSSIESLLSRKLDELRRSVDASLESRRQALEHAAVGGELAFRRLGSYDRVGPFKIEYSKRTVTISIGSEALTSVEEIDGQKLFEKIASEAALLNALVLPRESFFRVVKVAFAAAKADGRLSDGKAKVRELFPYIVVARQLASDSFKKKPNAKQFADYSLAEFAFELHKFGEHAQGWICAGERLCNQGPNMATQREAVVLPDAGGNTVQLLWLWTA
jgi:hypothetical protein